MAVWILTDSASDMPADNGLNVRVLPLTVTFGEVSYLDGVTLTKDEFYRKLEQEKELPKSSMISPAAFEEAYQKLPAGDEAVVVALSSKLSGTCYAATLAAEDFSNVHVVDSLNASAGQRVLVHYAAMLRDKGLAAADIAARLMEKRADVRFGAVLDTLEYLKRGGRISAGTALVGSMLNIKPLIAVQDGSVAMLDKVRGFKKGCKQLVEWVRSGGGIATNLPFYLAYTGISNKAVREFAAENAALWPGREEHLAFSRVGSVIGTHIGPHALGLAYFAQKS